MKKHQLANRARSSSARRTLGGMLALAGCAASVCAACTVAELSKDDTPCDDPGRCAADPPPTASEVDTCKQALGGPCASQYRALLDCVMRSQVCGPDGRTNPDAVRAACAHEDETYSQCVPSPPDAAAPMDASVIGDR